ncbi:hypothetical protein CLUG_04926 [Clavispora lusitaniae ATCC 42720]|uniref:Uncharacterized protein n=1 Tax=Clavispora lusitaniae (strain ATCC 42720) TaxID=306902 RepID=C4Y9N6_CLAL4|nr:uncharacterized protein CLUG_04926 [Clavispora lusitaniae ATCC 42720]EEQ40798.1 hypothetical protein CLUG_04926 [Clavispora lusitaniae ATCC 42720]
MASSKFDHGQSNSINGQSLRSNTPDQTPSLILSLSKPPSPLQIVAWFSRRLALPTAQTEVAQNKLHVAERRPVASHHHRGRGQPFAVAKPLQHFSGHRTHVGHRQALNVLHHLVHRRDLASASHSAANVLQRRKLALHVHEERQHQSVFGTAQLSLGDAAAANVGLHDLGELVARNSRHVLGSVHVARERDAEKTQVRVRVVEAQAVFHKRISVEHAEEPQEHALARAARRKRQPAAKKLSERGERIQVRAQEAGRLEGDSHVHERREVGVAGRHVRKRKLAADVGCCLLCFLSFWLLFCLPVAEKTSGHFLRRSNVNTHHGHHRALGNVVVGVIGRHVATSKRRHALVQAVERHAQASGAVGARVERLDQIHLGLVRKLGQLVRRRGARLAHLRLQQERRAHRSRHTLEHPPDVSVENQRSVQHQLASRPTHVVAAQPRQKLHHLHARMVLRRLERHAVKHVRHAAVGRRFVTGSGVYVCAQGRKVAGRRVGHHTEPVGKRGDVHGQGSSQAGEPPNTVFADSSGDAA